MKVSRDNNGMLDEMAIVDVLTRLIFDADTALQDRELLVLQLLEQVEESLLGASRRDISEYLRSMGVDEMIGLVKQIKQYIDRYPGVIASPGAGKASRLHH